MATVRVPDRDRDVLQDLLDLDVDKAKELVASLAKTDDSKVIIATLDDVSNQRGRLLFRALVSFRLLMRRIGIESPQFADAIKASFGRKDSGFPLDDLIGLEMFGQYAKTLDLRNAYEHILTGSRIVSDIRPVFPDAADDEDVSPVGDVEAAIVNHSLRVVYRTDTNEPEELYLALDLADLKRLRKQIDRALAKEAAAQRFIEKGGAVVLEPLMEGEG